MDEASIFSASSSLRPPPSHFRLSQPVSDRIFRALRHQLYLLYRSESDFFILGATGNVYKVSLSSTPSCTCPDPTNPCKHILFVLIRVLGISVDDPCLRRKTLRPCHLIRLLNAPMLPESMARVGLRERFHQLFSQARQSRAVVGVEEEEEEENDRTVCPICLDEMEKREKLVACGTCKNRVHEDCLSKWRRSRGRRSASCVVCRARWRERSDRENKYLNLAAYVNEDETVADGERRSSCDYN